MLLHSIAATGTDSPSLPHVITTNLDHYSITVTAKKLQASGTIGL